MENDWKMIEKWLKNGLKMPTVNDPNNTWGLFFLKITCRLPISLPDVEQVLWLLALGLNNIEYIFYSNVTCQG